MTELAPDLIRRVLVASNGEDLLWHVTPEGELAFSANCSDLFWWGTADAEPIETEDDVLLLEKSLRDLSSAGSDLLKSSGCDLYAARRRKKQINRAFMDVENAYYVGAQAAQLFREAAGG